MTETTPSFDGDEKTGISRRTVTKAMAWAVPVIAIAAPAPAFAASPGIISFTGAGCKLPGNSNDVYKGYAFRMSATNTTPDDITVTITDATLNGEDLGSVTVVDLNTCTVLGNPFVIPAGTTLSNLALITSDAPSSQQGELAVDFTVSGGNGGGEATAEVSSVPPIQGASCTAFSSAERDCINSIAAG